MSQDPATVLDGRLLAGWEHMTAQAGFQGIDPPAAFGFQQGIAPALPDGSYVVAPQYLFSPTATDDGVWITNALTQASQFTGFATGGIVRLMPLPYNVAAGTAIVDANFRQFLIGCGEQATILKVLPGSAGIGLTVRNSAVAYNGTTQRCGIANLAVDGANAVTGSTGIQAGDSARMILDNVASNNFTGTGAYCFHLLNSKFQTEQMSGSIYASNGTTCIGFDVTGTGTGSFDRPDLNCWINNFAGQDMVALQGGATSAFIQGGGLGIFGNCSNVASTNAVLRFAGTGSSIQYTNININVENDSSSAGPTTIVGGGGNQLTNCWGGMQFAAAPAAFTAASIAGMFFIFNGPINGDATLGSISTAGNVAVGDPGNGGTYPTNHTTVMRTVPAAARTGMIIQPGTASQNGRTCTIINVSANSITFAAAGTSNVADGVADVIAANNSATYYWDATSALWYRSV